jgi:transcription elongation factor SPT6
MEGAESDEENDRDAIANELFDQDDIGDEDEAPVAAPAKRPVDNRAPRLHAAQDEDVMDMEEEENSDTDSFIVDDDGKPIHSHKARGTRRFDDAALQEAQDIFGLDFDVEDLEEMEDEYDEEGEVGHLFSIHTLTF